MSVRKGIGAFVFALALWGATAYAGTVAVVDLDTDPAGSIGNAVMAGDSLYITNSGGAAQADTVSGGGDWDVDGKLYIGFTGKDATGGESIASEKVTVSVTGDMNVNAATWVGKWTTTGYGTFFPEIPIPATGKVELNVGGNLNVNITGDGFGAFMVGAQDAGSSTVINVTGDTTIYSGGNHFVAYNNAQLIMTTRTFNLDGGEIEVIGSSSTGFADRTQIITTATLGNAVHLTNEADLTIMRGALFDLSAGGDFLVEHESTLIGGSGGGKIALAAGGTLTVSHDSTVNLWRGSLDVSGTGSTVDVQGTLILGYHPSLTDVDGNKFTSFTAYDLNFANTAAIEITDDFVKKAVADFTTTDANAVVIAGSNSLTYNPDASWTTGDKALVENYYGKFIFTMSGTQILFKNLELASHLTDASAAREAMTNQIGNVFASNGVSANNIPAGLAANAAGAAQAITGVTVPGLPAPATDGGAGGNLNGAMLSALASGNSSFSSGGVSASFNSGFVNILNGNRSSNVTAVSMGVAGQVGRSIGNRIAENNQALARVQEETGSDYALASRILNCNYMNRVWVGGLGMWEDADSRKGMSGYKYDSYGVIAGYDRVFGAITAGAAFGFNAGDYEDKGAVSHDSDIENYSFSLYATYNHCSGFFASVMGGYTYSDNDINEHDGANWAREDFHTNTWNIGAKFGYDWKPTPCLTLTPSVGLNYVHAKNSDHDVNYGGVSLLRYDGMKNHSTSLPVELAASYCVRTGDDSALTVNANVGYSYNFRDDGVEGNIFMSGLGGATALRATGRESGRHTFNVGTGLKYTRNRFDCGVKYDYYGKADYNAHRVVGTVGVSF